MKKPLLIFLVGALSGAVVAGGVGVVSAVSDSQKPIVACANKETGAMRYSANGKCRRSERKLSWEALGQLSTVATAGPKGDAGSKGETGSKGDAGTPGATGATGPAGTGFNTVPSSFGSKTLIETEPWGCCDFGNDNLFLDFTLRNRTGGALTFSGGATYQFWLNYFDDAGTLIECTECSFEPGLIVVVAEPSSCSSVANGSTFSYQLVLRAVHLNKPNGARYFSMNFRAVASPIGTISPAEEMPFVSFSATPTPALSVSGIGAVGEPDQPVTMAC